MTKYTNVMSGVQILFVMNMKLQVVRLGTAKTCSLKIKRILNTVPHVEGWLMYELNLPFLYKKQN